MRKFMLPLLLLTLLFSTPNLGFLQEPSTSWSAIIIYGNYIAEMNLATITPNGVQKIIALPPQEVPWLTDEQLKLHARLSPNSDYLVVAENMYGDRLYFSAPPVIVHLETQTVNDSFFIPASSEDYFFSLGAISPDGTQVAISTGTYNGGLIQIYDLASGQLAQEVQTENYMHLINQWDEDGIWMSRTLYGYGLDFTKFYVWNPQFATLEETALFFEPLVGDRLAATGEVIQIGFDGNYSNNPWVGSPQAELWEIYDNVITYFPEAIIGTPSTVIMAGSPQYDFLWPKGSGEFTPSEFEPRWVLDGQAVLIGFRYGYTGLVYRNGTIINFEPRQNRFIAGTPTGWLEQDQTNQRLLNIVIEDDALIASEIELPQTEGIGKIVLVQAPELGQSITSVNFVPYDPGKRQVSTDDCQLKIQLAIGETYAYYGEIRGNILLSDVPNAGIPFERDIRVEEPFTILDGPICLDNFGIFWFVEFQDMRGWMHQAPDSDHLELHPYGQVD